MFTGMQSPHQFRALELVNGVLLQWIADQPSSLAPLLTFGLASCSAIASTLYQKSNNQHDKSLFSLMSELLRILNVYLLFTLIRATCFMTAITTLLVSFAASMSLHSIHNTHVPSLATLLTGTFVLAAVNSEHASWSKFFIMASFFVSKAFEIKLEEHGDNASTGSTALAYARLIRLAGVLAATVPLVFTAQSSLSFLIGLPSHLFLSTALLLLVLSLTASHVIPMQLYTGESGHVYLPTLCASILVNATLFNELTNTTWLGWFGLALVAASAYMTMVPHQAPDFVPLSSPSSNGEKGPFETPLAQPKTMTYVNFAVIYGIALVASIAMVFLSNLVSNGATLNGGQWEAQLYAAVKPHCSSLLDTVDYPRPIARTGLATYPRSGNSWVRSLVERSTGYRSGSAYCDPSLTDTFKSECNGENYFFEKTHYPAWSNEGLGWERYQQVVRSVRNPIDTIFSNFHLSESWKIDPAGNHTFRAKLDHKVGETEEEAWQLLWHAEHWAEHDSYWTAAPIPQYAFRYEDMRRSPMVYLQGMLTSFVPSEDLPSLAELSCALEQHAELQPYNPEKRNFFYAWDSIHPPVRDQILNTTSYNFCKWGYDRLLKEIRPGVQLDFDCNVVLKRS